MSTTREALFLKLCKSQGLPVPETEALFHPTRKWRWDFCWPVHKVALECDGGIWIQGKHGRGSGIVKDHEKRNAGAVLGWRLLVVTPSSLNTPSTFAMLSEALR